MDEKITMQDCFIFLGRIVLSVLAAFILQLCAEAILFHPVPYWSIYVGMIVTYLVLKKWE